MSILISLLVGMMFGLGLIVAGMTNPAKVIGFLDLAGPWDPSLSLVMAGAISLGLFAFRAAGRRKATLLGMPMNLPSGSQIDRRLILGSAIFGVGWGLAGICPGPGFVLLGTDTSKGAVFILALLVGMALFELQERIRAG